MNILWMTWKDPSHPDAGGAEVVQEQLVQRLVADGHNVTILTSAYLGSVPDETRGSLRIIRGGSRYTVHVRSMVYYMRYLRDWADIVIDEVNTAPFFAKFYARGVRRFVLIHQLAREIWHFELPKPLSYIGYAAEPLYIRALNNQKVITVSESTKNDLVTYGHKPHDISIISEGIQIQPIKSLAAIKKYSQPTVLVFGAMRAMKRTIESIQAFEYARDENPTLQLKLAGGNGGTYGSQVMDYIKHSRHASAIKYLGRVSDEQKIELMQKSHAILVSSVREGWGLIVTEANSQGTPAVVYDVPGLRDSVKNGETGIVTAPNPKAMADGITTLLRDSKKYAKLQKAGYEWSKAITFDQSYADFKKAVGV